MKRCLLYFVLMLSMLMIACQEAPPAPTPARGLGGAAKDDVAPVEAPKVMLSENSGGPNAVVVVSGEDFPAETFVEIRLGTVMTGIDPFVYVQTQTDEIGSFASSLIMPTIWPNTFATGQAELIVEAKTLTQPALAAETSFELLYTDAFQLYENELGNFVLPLPVGWQVSEPLNTPLGTMFLLGRGPLTAGDPAVSTILISDALTPARAAEQLFCGNSCLEEVRFERLELDGQPLYKTPVVSDGSPTLEWYFFPQGERLIYWSLHDPVTFKPLDDLQPSFVKNVVDDTTAVAAVTEVPATNTPTPQSVETATPSVTETPTTTPSATPNPFANINADAGPIQVTTDFLLAMIRQQIFVVGEAQPVLNKDYFEIFSADEPLLTLLQIDELFYAFSLSRIQAAGVVVRVELTLVNGEVVERFMVLEREADEGIWHIVDIKEDVAAVTTAIASPAAESATETGTPTTNPKATPSPEAAATEESSP